MNSFETKTEGLCIYCMDCVECCFKYFTFLSIQAILNEFDREQKKFEREKQRQKGKKAELEYSTY